ncbi:hypothetical protein SUGI_0582690 [Cryptomeria japonica]|uniref:uncharacterized protein LOC131069984 n=1 Tax=Cryptomeria japonica TaxID=3369 RepID=UPI002414AE89|nr:uncharacterized protein LOC131069984 [Cryptomeria japonica]GLJ29542.1 hypothetical protein SUGI_0582690 [Cryptomeria japonica]
MGNAHNTAKGSWAPRERVRQITDGIFEKVTEGKASANVDDVYTGILLSFNDINGMMPGIHIDPPSKEDVEKFDKDKNGHVEKEQFAAFILDKCTFDLITEINKDVTVSSFRWPALIMVGAPIVAGMTKDSSEKVPVIGKSLNNLSDSVLASAIAVVGMLLLQSISRPKLKKG